MHSVDSPVSTGLVLVCEKCGKRMKTDDNPSRELLSRLKKNSRELFDKGEVRAALTSCLDICPEDRISVALVMVDDPTTAPRFFTVKADNIDDTSRKILKELRKTVGSRKAIGC
jgi:predicted metal-binding protein